MPKLLKITGLGLAGVLGLLLLLAVVIVLLVDPNDFRDEITTAVQDATGRELTIEGELGLSLFPWLGLSLGETRLGNAPGFAGKDFARVVAVDIRVKLLPLLQQRLEMNTLHLRGLRVNLQRAADGRSNWGDLLASPGEAGGQQGASPTESTGSSVVALAIGGVNIEDAQVSWDDQQAGQRITVQQLSLRTGPIATGVPIDMELRSQLSVAQPALQTPLYLKGRFSLEPQAQRYRLDELDLSLNLRGDALPVSPLPVRLMGSVAADMAQQQLRLTGLQLQALGLNVRAEVSVQNILSSLTADGQLSLAEFSLRDVSKRLGIALPATADARVLSKARLAVDFAGSSDAVALKKIQLVLDDSNLSGKLSLQDFAQPAVRLDLRLDALDADRYLPPAVDTLPPSPTGALAGATQLPLDLLRGLDVKGNLRVGKLTLANARLSNLRLGLVAKAGKLRLSPVQAELYQGTYRGDLRLDVRTDTPKVSANEKISAVHVGPLLKDVLGEDKVSGVANLTAKVRAVGITPEAITRSLTGAANFSFADGAVKGVNLGQLIREAYAKIKKQPAPPKSTHQTDFAAMSGSVTIRNGVVKNQDLRVSSPALRVAGKGTVDLSGQRINYLLNTAIVETDEGQGGRDVSELKSLTIPVRVTGTFAEPRFALDLAPVLKTKAKARLKKEKARVKKKAKQKLQQKKAEVKKRVQKKLDDKLKGLFR